MYCSSKTKQLFHKAKGNDQSEVSIIIHVNYDNHHSLIGCKMIKN